MDKESSFDLLGLSPATNLVPFLSPPIQPEHQRFQKDILHRHQHNASDQELQNIDNNSGHWDQTPGRFCNIDGCSGMGESDQPVYVS
jgi:hypothetical protein